MVTEGEDLQMLVLATLYPQHLMESGSKGWEQQQVAPSGVTILRKPQVAGLLALGISHVCLGSRDS